MDTTENRMNMQETEELELDRLDPVSGGGFLKDWWNEKVRDVADWVLDLRANGGIKHKHPKP